MERDGLEVLEQETGGVAIIAGKETRKGRYGLRLQIHASASEGYVDISLDQFGAVVRDKLDPYIFNTMQCAYRAKAVKGGVL
jgi:hypothetical protein